MALDKLADDAAAYVDGDAGAAYVGGGSVSSAAAVAAALSNELPIVVYNLYTVPKSGEDGRERSAVGNVETQTDTLTCVTGEIMSRYPAD